jgi:hypothetical protein
VCVRRHSCPFSIFTLHLFPRCGGGGRGGVRAREEPATPPSPVVARGKRKKHHTFVEQEEAADLTAAQERFVETQKLLSFDTK